MLDGIPYPGDLPPPPGFVRVAWDQVAAGDEVYLACLDPDAPETSAPRGPYRVLGRFLLEFTPARHPVQEVGERLLRRSHRRTTTGRPPG